ncbi:MAG: RNA polymerase sigma factor [Clostridia bacterium]|nr:RNA polymerase sigma factor [Clostridia bacterium]
MDQGAKYYEKYLDGDIAGLEELVREYRYGLILYINGIVRDTFAAEDLCEDTFFRLMVKRPKFDGRSSFKTWLYGIGRNLALDMIKHEKRLIRVDLESAEAKADRELLEQSYIDSERKKALLSQLDELPRTERELIWLSYFEDMSAKEVSSLTGRTVAAVNKALSRAREKLREKMESEGYGNEDQ